MILEKAKKEKLKVVIFLCSISFICFTSCNFGKKTNNDGKINLTNENSIKVDETLNPANCSFCEWWNLKYSDIPSHEKGKYSDYKYIYNYSIEDLLKYYQILEIAHWNGEIGYRQTEYDQIAEKTRLHKNFFYELDSYIGLEYMKYLGGITKEYFKANKELGIEPDYYSPINGTAYIGLLTLNCSIVIDSNKDDPYLDEKIESKISYLKDNLPDIIQGFKVTDVKYIDKVSGTSGYLSKGYLWRRKDNCFMKFTNYRKGTKAEKSPEKEDDWLSRSWNDSKKIESYYDIK